MAAHAGQGFQAGTGGGVGLVAQALQGQGSSGVQRFQQRVDVVGLAAVQAASRRFQGALDAVRAVEQRGLPARVAFTQRRVLPAGGGAGVLLAQDGADQAREQRLRAAREGAGPPGRYWASSRSLTGANVSGTVGTGGVGGAAGAAGGRRAGIRAG
ncbi:hypothetical protein [Deinococcus aquaticus]|uniref:hypothetical protein n=1 Tax=Deinococcus aquaticus TaxID=328692 RepID=UPI003623A083